VPVRIYQLAKQLKIDNRTLCDICAKAGITGKGSALASLSDEEVEKVKAFLQRGKSGAGSARGVSETQSSASQAIRREDYIAPTAAASGKVPVLPSKPAKSKPAPAKEKEEKQPASPEKKKDEQVQPPRPSEKAPPPIKLAPVPVAKKAPPKEKREELPAQKPDIKLPPDAIRAGKLGAKPLAEHLRRQEEKRKAAEKTSAPGTLPAEEPSPADLVPAARARARGPGKKEKEKEKKGKERGLDAVERDELATTLGGREHRQLKRKRAAADRRRRTDEDEESPAPVARRTHIRRTGANTAAPRKGKIIVNLPCTVREFSEAIGVPARLILRKLLELGQMCTIAADLDADTAELLAVELGVDVEVHRPVDLAEQLLPALEQEDDPEKLQPRPPVVTFLGHVDHGKTSLLDRIIGIDVVSREKGGITQHIRAYRIEKDGRPIAFVDTPGHEAFTAMRARGANVTDIVVLVVAADDGVMPQTEEAIHHARAAGVPIVVALNKIDLPGVNPQRVYEQLAAAELLPSEWGGEIEVIKTSAVTGQGIDELLETVLTVAELHELKADPDRPGVGTCLEAALHEGRGVVAKVLVQKGSVSVGDVVFCGTAYGRVKAMFDTLDMNRRHQRVGPSTPVELIGLNTPPEAGERFYVLPEISQARELAERRLEQQRRQELSSRRAHVTLENLFERLGRDEEVQTLNLIIRADTRGSIEAIRKELNKLEHPEVRLRVLQALVGGITEADVHLADASDAVIIGFNVVPDETARRLAEQLGVQIRRYDIIYQITDDLKAAVEGLLKPLQQERELGRALVQRVFRISRVGTVAGCRVLAGNIERDARVRVIRDNRVIGDYPLDSLKREKDDARQVREGLECGMKLAGFDDLKEGDILEAYKIEEVARTL